MAALVDIAKAVADELDVPAGTFSQDFEAVFYRHRPVSVEVKDLTGIRVGVYPYSREQSNAGRGLVEDAAVVAVEVIAAAAVSDSDTVDGLMELTDELSDYFLQRRLTTQGALCRETRNDPPYDGPLLEGKGVFASVTMLTFIQHRKP